MAESDNHAHNGSGPFRRYSPPSSGNGETGRPGSSLPRYPQPDGTGLNRAGPAAQASPNRANRSARRRWRQWVQPQTPVAQPSASPATAPVSSPVVPQGKPASPRPPSIPQPSVIVTGAQPNPAGGRGPTGRAQPQPIVNRSPANKVTPLRQRPVWSTPSGVNDAPTKLPQPPSQRRSPARRRPHRSAPRPILYGVRLLICGVGLAAIAGTLLSVLNPERSGTTADTPSPEEVAVPGTNLGNQRRLSTVDAPLPLADELTYLENTLLELEALAPGLAQATFALDLDTGNYVDVNGAGAIAAASTIKLPILVAFLDAVDNGQITLEQGIVLQEQQIVGGSGDLQTAAPGTRFTALEVATQMMTQSDNTATQMMIDLLGGNQSLNQQFQDWGLTATVLRNPLPDLEGTNTTSAQDLVRIMALVEQGDLLTLRSRDRLLGIMQRTYSRDLIPGGVADDEALVFNKTGDIGTLLGDVALVDAPNGKRYILATLIQRPHNDGRASELIRRISEVIHGEMNQPVAPVGGAVAPETAPAVPSEELPAEAEPIDEGAGVPQG
ncbi:MAG: serine hydrolase [Leptolyngbya sp. RL_3_1]|nr:serine hydrolase [Leptolyngbya sp. RL_3_1]